MLHKILQLKKLKLLNKLQAPKVKHSIFKTGKTKKIVMDLNTLNPNLNLNQVKAPKPKPKRKNLLQVKKMSTSTSASMKMIMELMVKEVSTQELALVETAMAATLEEVAMAKEMAMVLREEDPLEHTEEDLLPEMEDNQEEDLLAKEEDLLVDKAAADSTTVPTEDLTSKTLSLSFLTDIKVAVAICTMILIKFNRRDPPRMKSSQTFIKLTSV